MATSYQQSHEIFKTALPHGDLARCIKRQAFGAFQKKKCEQEEQKWLLKATRLQTCLHQQYRS